MKTCWKTLNCAEISVMSYAEIATQWVGQLLDCEPWGIPGFRDTRISSFAPSRGVSETAGNRFCILFIVVMIAVIVSVDLLFLRHYFAARLIVNIGIVVVFVIAYFILFKRV